MKASFFLCLRLCRNFGKRLYGYPSVEAVATNLSSVFLANVDFSLFEFVTLSIPYNAKAPTSSVKLLHKYTRIQFCYVEKHGISITQKAVFNLKKLDRFHDSNGKYRDHRENGGSFLGFIRPAVWESLDRSPLKWDMYTIGDHYIRCIWGWLLRVPSQQYHQFPYE